MTIPQPYSASARARRRAALAADEAAAAAAPAPGTLPRGGPQADADRALLHMRPPPEQGAGKSDHAPPQATRLLLRSTRLALARWALDRPAAVAAAWASPPPPASARTQACHSLEALLSLQAPAVPATRPKQAIGPPPVWSAAQLAGFLDAAQAHCLTVPSQAPVVVMASSGGPRQLPVLTPLLALWLAREGVQVLLHGPVLDPAGVTSAEVLRNLGLAPASTAAEVARAWSRREPAFMPTSTLCPALAPLLQRAHGVAWRSLARRLSRLLDPIVGAPTLRVAHHGSHETGQLLTRWAEQEGAAVMLLRGAEGEPVADLRRRPRIDTWLAGARQAGFSCAAQNKGPVAPPLWPQQADAATTALYAQAVLSGERPAPAPLAAQVALILGLMPGLPQRLLQARRLRPPQRR